MPRTFASGEVLLGRYRVEALLGRSAERTVLRVADTHYEHALVIELLSPEVMSAPGAASRFLRSARSAARLRIDNLAQVLDAGVFPDGTPYLLREYVDGIDLASELARRRMMPIGLAVDHALQVCEALAEAHRHGVVHAGLRPSKLMVTARGDGAPQIKVLDCGIARPAGSEPGGAALHRSALAYLALEQLSGAAPGVAADIWSLGAILYECVNARRAFEDAEPLCVAIQVATRPPAAMDPRVPRGLQAVIVRCLAKRPRRRFATVAALAAALAPYAGDPRAAEQIVERTQRMLLAPSQVQATARPAPLARARLHRDPDLVEARARRRRHALVLVAAIPALALVSAVVGAALSDRLRSTVPLVPALRVVDSSSAWSAWSAAAAASASSAPMPPASVRWGGGLPHPRINCDPYADAHCSTDDGRAAIPAELDPAGRAGTGRSGAGRGQQIVALRAALRRRDAPAVDRWLRTLALGASARGEVLAMLTGADAPQIWRALRIASALGDANACSELPRYVDGAGGGAGRRGVAELAWRVCTLPAPSAAARWSSPLESAAAPR